MVVSSTVNATVGERDSDMGGGALFHDNRVEVAPLPGVGGWELGFKLTPPPTPDPCEGEGVPTGARRQSLP